MKARACSGFYFQLLLRHLLHLHSPNQPILKNSQIGPPLLHLPALPLNRLMQSRGKPMSDPFHQFLGGVPLAIGQHLSQLFQHRHSQTFLHTCPQVKLQSVRISLHESMLAAILEIVNRYTDKVYVHFTCHLWLINVPPSLSPSRPTKRLS